MDSIFNYFILTGFTGFIGSCNRSQVQGSTFRVKDKEGNIDPNSSLTILIFPNNCQFGSNFWIRPDEVDAFLVSTHPKCGLGTKNGTLDPESLNVRTFLMQVIQFNTPLRITKKIPCRSQRLRGE
jgi:hypothetical protein